VGACSLCAAAPPPLSALTLPFLSPPAVLQVASEAVSNMRTVAAFSAEDKVLALFNSHLAGPLQRAFKRGQIAGIGFGSGQFALFASFGLALWYAGQLVSQGHGEFGQVLKVFMVSPAPPHPRPRQARPLRAGHRRRHPWARGPPSRPCGSEPLVCLCAQVMIVSAFAIGEALG
jgi:hypothetical protein